MCSWLYRLWAAFIPCRSLKEEPANLGEGILMFNKIWASNRPYEAPLAELTLHWIVRHRRIRPPPRRRLQLRHQRHLVSTGSHQRHHLFRPRVPPMVCTFFWALVA